MSDAKDPYRGMSETSKTEMEHWVRRMDTKRRSRNRWTAAELVAMGTEMLMNSIEKAGSPTAVSYSLGVALGLMLSTCHGEARRRALGFLHAGYMKGLQITAQSEADQDAAAGRQALAEALGGVAKGETAMSEALGDVLEMPMTESDEQGEESTPDNVLDAADDE